MSKEVNEKEKLFQELNDRMVKDLGIKDKLKKEKDRDKKMTYPEFVERYYPKQPKNDK